jgi:hypothetical protein
LKTWNIHYKDFVFDDKKEFKPIIVDKSTDTLSSNNNIEHLLKSIVFFQILPTITNQTGAVIREMTLKILHWTI